MNTEVPNLSQNAESEGYNMDCGKTWIYPTNYEVRDYQYNIVNEALFKNTMVCLPTGLGKTFIAAVVMYNFFRWYPCGKIIFMAPTKPLVKQQMEACYNITAIPRNATAELTGSTAHTSRGDIWAEKRVFFITPQVLQNDLERITQLAKQIKCLVFDEAHRARGNHAYCEVIKKITPITGHFRVLALTATPGNTVTDVVKVCADLLIAHVEIRTEESSDVTSFVFKKNIDTVVVPIDGKLREIRDDYIKVLDKYVRVLVKYRVIQGNAGSLSKGRIFHIKNEYVEKHRYSRDSAHNEIMKNLTVCMSLYHAYEVLTKHGLRGFLKYFMEHGDDPLLKHDCGIKAIMDDVSNYLGDIPSVDMLPDGTIPDVPLDCRFGHPKFYKMADILVKHFNVNGTNSKVIVFCEYRESVFEAFTILLKHKPLIKPKVFLGKGSISAGQQMSVVESFRSGTCNTLISTSIGEEGLDIGDVNLVVCFDTSNKSSIRMIQRIGRTGRKKDGNVIMLVTEGAEQRLLQDALAHKNYMADVIIKSKELTQNLYRENPRMVPIDVDPKCHKMFITVPKPVQKLKNGNLRNMFKNAEQSSADLLSDVEIMDFEDRIPVCKLLCSMRMSDVIKSDVNVTGPDVESQGRLQSVMGRIGSSRDSKELVSLLQFSNSMRYDIPISLNRSLKTKLASNDNFKQSDLRTMLKKQPATQCTQIYTQEVIGDFDRAVFKQLQHELNNFLLRSDLQSDNCKICENFFSCSIHQLKKEDDFKPGYWQRPKLSLLELTDEALAACLASPKSSEICEIDFDTDDDLFANFDIADDLSPVINNFSSNYQDDQNTKVVEHNEEGESVVETGNHGNKLTGDDTKFVDGDVKIVNIDSKLGSTFEEGNLDLEMSENLPPQKLLPFSFPKGADQILKNYVQEDTESYVDNNSTTKQNTLQELLVQHKSTLNFFKVNNIDEFFSSTVPEKVSEDLDATIICSQSSLILAGSKSSKLVKSPNLFEDKPQTPPPRQDLSESPILNSYPENYCTPPRNCVNLVESPILGSCQKKLDRRRSKTQKRLFSQTANGDDTNSGLPEKKIRKNCGKESLQISDIFDSDILQIVNSVGNEDLSQKKLSSDVNYHQKDLLRNVLSSSQKTTYGDPEIFETKSDHSFQTAKLSQSIQSKSSSDYLLSSAKSIPNEDDLLGMELIRGTHISQCTQKSSRSEGLVPPEFPMYESNNQLLNSQRKPLNDNLTHNKLTCDQMISQNSERSRNLGTALQKPATLVNAYAKDLSGKTKPELDEIKSSKDEQPMKRKRPYVYSPDLFDTTSNSDSDIAIKNDHSSQIRENITPPSIVIEDSDVEQSPVKLVSQISSDFQNSGQARKKLKRSNSPKYQDKPTPTTMIRINNLKENSRHSMRDTQKNLTEGADSKSIGEINQLAKPIGNKEAATTNVRPNQSIGVKKIGVTPKKKWTIDDICDFSILDLITSDTKKTVSEPKIPVDNLVHPTAIPCNNTVGNSVTGCESDGKNYKSSSIESPKQNLRNIGTNRNKFATKKLHDTEKLHDTKTSNKSLSLHDFLDESILEMLEPTKPQVTTSKNVVPKVVESLSMENIFDASFLEVIETAKPNHSTKLDTSVDRILKKYSQMDNPNGEDVNCDSPVIADRSLNETVATQTKTKEIIKSPSVVSICDSDDDFETSPLRKRSPVIRGKRKLTKRKGNDFLDLEAELSSDVEVSEDDKSGSSLDVFEASFVNDETQNFGNNATMRAHYLQSVRSPIVQRGKFKIPELPQRVNEDIYSQPVRDMDTTYLEDSFCVKDDSSSSQEELSELEIAEMVLKENRKRKRSQTCSTKRKRIITIDSDSD